MNPVDKIYKDLWRRGNDLGHGFPVGLHDDTPKQAAERCRLTDIREIDPEGNVVCVYKGQTLVICDCNGPWAVRIGGVTDD